LGLVVSEPDPSADVDYESLTKAELLELARARGLEVSARMTKADLVRLLSGQG
jgi:hypothetical protein